MGCCESCLRSVGLLGGNEHTSDEETTPLIRSNTQIPAPTKSTVSKIDTTKAYQEVIEDAQEKFLSTFNRRRKASVTEVPALRQKLQEVKADISTISPTFRKDNNLTAAMGVASGSSSRGKSSGGGGNVTADRAGQIVDILSDAVQVPQAIDVAMDALAADIISIVSVQGQSLESRSALVQFKPLSGLSH